VKKFIVLLSGISVLLLQGCATHMTRPAGPPQPPQVKFGTFPNVEVQPVVMAPDYSDQKANIKAAKKIDENIVVQMKSIFPQMNSATKKPGKTLVVKPLIKEIKFISGNARFWVGPFAGSSAVLMEVSYIDKDTGTVIASPEFFTSSSAMGGGFSIGASDNVMLTRTAVQIGDYTRANY